MKSWHGGFSLHRIASSPWQKSALFAVSIVGAVCDRAFFLELTKCGRSQTAPTVGNPSFRLLPRAARDGYAQAKDRPYWDGTESGPGSSQTYKMVSFAEVRRRQVHPVSLQTRWSTLRGSARMKSPAYSFLSLTISSPESKCN